MANREWRALDHYDEDFDCNNNDLNNKDADLVAKMKQESHEWIVVKDSEKVRIHTTDTQVAISLQLAIQAAIAVVINIAIGSNDQGKSVVEDLKQFIRTKQRNTQKTIIESCKNVVVVTKDTDTAVNIQAMLQILLAIVAKLDVG